MPARTPDPHAVAATKQNSQITSLLTGQVQRLIDSQRAFEQDISRVIGALERQLAALAVQITERDAALADFEVRTTRTLATIANRLPPEGAPPAATRKDLEDVALDFASEIRGHTSAINVQKETLYTLREALVRRGLADAPHAYSTVLRERQHGA